MTAIVFWLVKGAGSGVSPEAMLASLTLSGLKYYRHSEFTHSRPWSAGIMLSIQVRWDIQWYSDGHHL